MHDISHHLEWQKSFVLRQGHFGLRPVFGIFWPSEGLRPPSGQKNPKNGPQAKKPGCSTKKLSFIMLILCISGWNIPWFYACVAGAIELIWAVRWGDILLPSRQHIPKICGERKVHSVFFQWKKLRVEPLAFHERGGCLRGKRDSPFLIHPRFLLKFR